MTASNRSSSRVVVVTGASAGLGSEIATAMVKRGLARTIVLTARRLDRLESLAQTLRHIDPALRVLTIPTDLADHDAPARLARQTLQETGGIDVLINNAGLGLPTLFADGVPEQLQDQLTVNFTAPLMLTRLLLPSLIERRGTVINIGSAITCVANSALGAYGATKAGLAYWNDALRRELAGTGVAVCLVEPGPIHTEFMTALAGRVAEGSEPNSILDNAKPWMTARVEDVAARVVGLIERPRRRVSYTKRFVWTFRAVGAFCWLFPAIGDWFVVKLSRGRGFNS